MTRSDRTAESVLAAMREAGVAKLNRPKIERLRQTLGLAAPTLEQALNALEAHDLVRVYWIASRDDAMQPWLVELLGPRV